MKIKSTAFLRFISQSNLFISVCAFFFTKFCLAMLQLTDLDKLSDYPSFVALSVFIVYGLQRIVESKKYNPSSAKNKYEWYNEHFLLMIFLVAAAGLALVVQFTSLFIHEFWIILPPVIVSLLYFAGPHPLKTINFGKGFFIGITWAYVCVLLPELISGPGSVGKDAFSKTACVFFFISALCIPFDIRDAEDDRVKRIYSLPVVFGNTTSKLIAALLLLFSGFFAFVLIKNKTFSVSLILSNLMALPIVVFSSPRNHPFYFSLLTEGLLLLPIIFLQVLLKFI